MASTLYQDVVTGQSESRISVVLTKLVYRHDLHRYHHDPSFPGRYLHFQQGNSQFQLSQPEIKDQTYAKNIVMPLYVCQQITLSSLNFDNISCFC